MSSTMPEHGIALPVQVGSSFRKGNEQSQLHTLRYSFKPGSVSSKRPGKLRIRGEDAKLKVGENVFRGKANAHKASECVLLCDGNGVWRIERLDTSVTNLKPER